MINKWNFTNVKKQVFFTTCWLVITLGLNFLLIFAPNYFMIAAAAPYLNILAFLTQLLIYILLTWFLISVFIAMLAALQRTHDGGDLDDW